MTDLGTLGGTYSEASAIDDAGQVAGASTLPNGEVRAVVWQSGAPTSLGTLGGATDSYAFDINTAGQVVGEVRFADGSARAFLWQNGTMTDLNDLLPPNAGVVLSGATRINDAGQMSPTSTTSSGCYSRLDNGGRSVRSASLRHVAGAIFRPRAARRGSPRDRGSSSSARPGPEDIRRHLVLDVRLEHVEHREVPTGLRPMGLRTRDHRRRRSGRASACFPHRACRAARSRRRRARPRPASPPLDPRGPWRRPPFRRSRRSA